MVTTVPPVFLPLLHEITFFTDELQFILEQYPFSNS
jgi:hypothetical protein